MTSNSMYTCKKDSFVSEDEKIARNVIWNLTSLLRILLFRIVCISGRGVPGLMIALTSWWPHNHKTKKFSDFLKIDFSSQRRIFLKVVTINNFVLKWEKSSRSKTCCFARDTVSIDYNEDHKGPHRISLVKIGKYSIVICKKKISSAFIHNKQTLQSVRQIGVLRRRLF